MLRYEPCHLWKILNIKKHFKKDYKKTLTIKKVCRYYYEFEGAKDEKQEKYKGAIILLAGEKSIEII